MLRILLRLGVVVTLAVVATVVLSAIVPRGMQLVASQACPEGTERSFVVRQPHQANPAQTVRAYSLVCVGDGGVEVANTVTVLALLFAASFIVLFVLSFPVTRVARVRVPEPGPFGPAPDRIGIAPVSSSMTQALGWFGMAMGCGFTIGASVAAWAWLALDTPFRAEACGSGSSRGTCQQGESVNQLLTGVFGAIGLLLLAIGLAALWRVRRRTQLRQELWSAGRRATGRVVKVEPTTTKHNGLRVYRYDVEVAPPDGGASFIVTDHGLGVRDVGPGTEVAVAYDPTDTGRAVVIGQTRVRERDEAPPERGLV